MIETTVALVLVYLAIGLLIGGDDWEPVRGGGLIRMDRPTLAVFLKLFFWPFYIFRTIMVILFVVVAGLSIFVFTSCIKDCRDNKGERYVKKTNDA